MRYFSAFSALETTGAQHRINFFSWEVSVCPGKSQCTCMHRYQKQKRKCCFKQILQHKYCGSKPALQQVNFSFLRFVYLLQSWSTKRGRGRDLPFNGLLTKMTSVAEPVQSRGPEVTSESTARMQGPTHLDHLQLPSQVYQQGASLKVEWLGL